MEPEGTVPVVWVFCATPTEARPVARRLRPWGDRVRVVETGIGPDAVRRGFEQERRRWEGKPRLVLSVGLAGGLDPKLRKGEVVGMADPALEWVLEKVRIRPVRFALSPTVLRRRQEKREWWERTGAEVVDMETLALQEMANREGIPFLALRIIGDSAEEDLPVDFSRFLDERGGLRIWPLLGHVLAHPLHLFGLVRLGWESRRWMQRLAGVVAQVMECVLGAS